ncbi:hypothetical protein C4J88_2867 [Pseudomonas sp. R4-39-08]|uniref:avidin/streptavidin family protein n=1 Tax=Pseudomonas sp. R4-39-08 TaxID=1173288 RepID=UPI000F57C72E|nr:avidin/streptavidin family protein [Pseudomonas sp. R4-39-08]AZF37649.1 hypothetical protein C4J88_2867 [Pseudomonas sp. R4-39-08]
MDNQHPPTRLVVPMQRGAYQNNGASPWFCTLKLGTPAQPLRFAIDTGTNMNWITSTLCPADQCVHFSGGRFDFAASSTFAFTDCLRRPYSFGPWGTMQVEAACDVLDVPGDDLVDIQLFLTAAYEGEQFKQLDWDGGLGLPCSSAYLENRSSFVLQSLMREGQLAPTCPYVTFDWNSRSRNGTCQMGAVDPSKTQGPHLFLPWSVYNKLPGVEYIWSTALESYSVGSHLLARDIQFALDSGSSQFKGDDSLMRQTLALIAQGEHPDIVLGFTDGEITLGADLYDCLIEEGPQKGQRLPQFAPLGMTDLVLVGSLVMEHCYTVYEYQVVKCDREVYSLAPVGVWLFNRPDGPQIITRSSSKRFVPGARAVLNHKVTLPGTMAKTTSVAGIWKNDYGSVMSLAVSGHNIHGSYRSSTGSTGEYRITGYSAGPGATRTKSQPVALAIEWHDLGNEKPDPSWNWTSGLSGQLSVSPEGDVLTLSHLLVASGDFPEFASCGTYVDKLIYHRAEPSLRHAPVAPSEWLPVENALAGRWNAADGTSLVLSVRSDSQQRFGSVHGHFTSVHSSIATEISGFTDIHALASKLTLQSVSITVATTQDSTVSSLSGILDLKSDTLHLQVLASSSIAPDHAYLATKLSAMQFTRAT